MKLELSKKRQELFIKTVVWKQLVSFFQEQKNIDISEYLLSVKIRQKKITVKVQGSVLRQQLYLEQERIIQLLTPHFVNIGERIEDFIFVYK